MLAILLHLLSFYGWWRIGLALSLSSSQTAKAFDSLLLRSVKSSTGDRDIVDETRQWPLKLGVVTDAASQKGRKDLNTCNRRQNSSLCVTRHMKPRICAKFVPYECSWNVTNIESSYKTAEPFILRDVRSERPAPMFDLTP